MTLTHLSLQRARRMPVAYTNEQRLRAFRSVAPVDRHNAFRWPFHSSQPVGSSPPTTGPVGCFSFARYAAEQSAPDTDYFTTHSYAELAGGF